MTPIPFPQLMDWILTEKENQNSVFGVHKAYTADQNKSLNLFGGRIETPFGPAAGPHTQLAQNIVAAYYAGSRFFELKTVQILDGEDLPVSKPCIRAEDECYNVEWSTELTVPQAFEEYVKAWFAIQIISREYGLGSPDGFLFNMSVGYDLEGIKSPKIDRFLNGMRDASQTDIYRECRQWILDHADRLSHMSREEAEHLPSCICSSVTLSTLHGCPSQEIEKIAGYLLKEKGFHTFIKCNPTLLGYEYARETLDAMGYGYVEFGDFHFRDDLQYEDAVLMLTRLMALADGLGLSFGVKITNTFPVDIRHGELPGQEMYMSGRSLYPLSISLAAKLAAEFDGKLRISYSGGADYFNIGRIYDAGIWPVTIATTVLKPGGYGRMVQIAEELAGREYVPFTAVNAEFAAELAKSAKTDAHHTKSVKPLPSRKMKKKVPLLDCFVSPCKEGCPIHQDITAYMKLAREERYLEALQVITEKNPLPFITGTICAHNCMGRCTRNAYEEPVDIRSMKLICAEKGYDAFIKTVEKPAVLYTEKAAVVGGGPAGMAAACFLARAGMEVTLFEKSGSLGGVVRRVIPEFRIPDEAIDRDASLLEALGVKIRLHAEAPSVKELKDAGYEHIVLAVGASAPGICNLEEGTAVNALSFLEEYKKTGGHTDIGRRVAVIGGGNTAMDAARAAARTVGVESVSLVYRRTRQYMPADEEELLLALEEGVEFAELLSPVSHQGGMLICSVMKLGDADASGRRRPIDTGEQVELPVDTVIAATGERVDAEFYLANDIALDERGRVLTNQDTLETSVKNVYAAGDGLNGPATVVEAIRDAMKCASAILGRPAANDFNGEPVDKEAIYAKKGVLKSADCGQPDNVRCLDCGGVCENCADVCPNRANLSVQVPGMEKAQIIHVDAMCNECGNCMSFCPYDSAPYKDKFTLFANEADLKDSTNEGFMILDRKDKRFRVRYLSEITDTEAGGKSPKIPAGLQAIMCAVCEDYPYLLSE